MSDEKPRFEVVKKAYLVDHKTGIEFHFDDDGDLDLEGAGSYLEPDQALALARFIPAELNDDNEPSPYGIHTFN